MICGLLVKIHYKICFLTYIPKKCFIFCDCSLANPHRGMIDCHMLTDRLDNMVTTNQIRSPCKSSAAFISGLPVLWMTTMTRGSGRDVHKAL